MSFTKAQGTGIFVAHSRPIAISKITSSNLFLPNGITVLIGGNPHGFFKYSGKMGHINKANLFCDISDPAGRILEKLNRFFNPCMIQKL